MQAETEVSQEFTHVEFSHRLGTEPPYKVMLQMAAKEYD